MARCARGRRAIPRSWAYQAEVHGVGSPLDPPPDNFRSQCQHNCWYFLPWHRWYLSYFEQIIRSVLIDLAEVPDDVAASWALPYWNYASPGADRLPPEFEKSTAWDGRENPLYDATRNSGINERTAAMDPLQSKPLPGVLRQQFSSSDHNVATFAGTDSGWQHLREGGGVKGGLEGTPHDAVHGFVNGNMGDFWSAGLDPVFWLHHCNIDRYWEVRGPDDDPIGTWANVTFHFRDASRSGVVVNADECVETIGQLGYRYDDTVRRRPALLKPFG